MEVLRIGTPALLTIQTGINEPRYANLRGMVIHPARPRRAPGCGAGPPGRSW